MPAERERSQGVEGRAAGVEALVELAGPARIQGKSPAGVESMLRRSRRSKLSLKRRAVKRGSYLQHRVGPTDPVNP